MWSGRVIEMASWAGRTGTWTGMRGMGVGVREGCYVSPVLSLLPEAALYCIVFLSLQLHTFGLASSYPALRPLFGYAATSTLTCSAPP